MKTQNIFIALIVIGVVILAFTVLKKDDKTDTDGGDGAGDGTGDGTGTGNDTGNDTGVQGASVRRRVVNMNMAKSKTGNWKFT